MNATTPYLLIALFVLGGGAWFHGQGQAVRLRLAAGAQPHSRSPFHGALCAGAAVLAGLSGWVASGSLAGALPLSGVTRDGLALLGMVSGAVAAALWSGRRSGPERQARTEVERAARYAMMAVASLSVLVTLGIILSLLFEAVLFFADVSVFDFVFGTNWAPQTALQSDGGEAAGSFGSLPVFAGTLMVTLVAIAVAAPMGLMIAVYLSEYAKPRRRAVLKPVVEVLAGIPPVVYGFFALVSVGPLIRDAAGALGLTVPVQSALAAGLVMGLMVLPLVSSLADDVINAVPQSLRDGSLALGATQSETVRRVVFPSALPGIVGAVLLAVSRAVGETMIVVIVAGRGAVLTANPLDTVTTVTVQIVALLTGDQVFDSAQTRAAFALGLMLFTATLALNAVALLVVRRYRSRPS